MLNGNNKEKWKMKSLVLLFFWAMKWTAAAQDLGEIVETIESEDAYQFNFTSNPTSIDFQKVYEDFTIQSISCKRNDVEVGRADLEQVVSQDDELETLSCEELDPCTEYLISIEIQMNEPAEEPTNIIELTVSTAYRSPGQIQLFRIEDFENGTVKITWEPPEQKTCLYFYVFTWATVQCLEDPDNPECNFNHRNNSVNDERNFIIENLEGCVPYKIYCQVNGNETSEPSSDLELQNQGPSSVVELKGDVLSSENVTITWKPSEVNKVCIKEYRINITGPSYSEIVQVQENTFDVQGLKPCGNYEVQTTALGINGINSQPAVLTFQMQTDKPSMASNLRQVSQYPKQIIVEWDEPDFAELCVNHYLVTYWYYDESGTQKPNNDSTSTDETRKTISNLIACTEYTVQVVAAVGANGIENSNPAQFTAETIPTTLDPPTGPELTSGTSNSLELSSRSFDSTNNCPLLYAKFACTITSTSQDAPIKNGETIVEIQNNRKYFSAVVAPLSPFSEYVCQTSVYNIAGWSRTASAVLKTTADYPDPPEMVEIKAVTTSTVNVKWRNPKYANGVITLYKVYAQTIGPKNRVPEYCSEPKKPSVSTLVEANKFEYTFSDFLPYYEYSIQVSASNEMGYSIYTVPTIATTLPSVPQPVYNFSLFEIDGPILSQDEYKAEATIIWYLPCSPNGKIIRFEGTILGQRDTYDDETHIWHRSVDQTHLEENNSFTFRENRLKPEFSYTVTISVIVEDCDESSSEISLTFQSPAGIPPTADISETSEVDAFATANPTTTALVKIPTGIMESKMGHLLYVALLLSEKGCQEDPEPSMELMDCEILWPATLNWFEANTKACVSQYQTTPLRWKPTYGKKIGFQNKSEQIEFLIGDEVCREGFQKYCNGPLKPDTKYSLMIRLFTKSGYSDTAVIVFQTDAKVQVVFILLIVVSCLLCAFLFGFIYLWTTKKIIWHRESVHGIEEQTGDATAKNFLQYYQDLSRKEKIQREFKELVAITTDPSNLCNMASKANETKNRYTNIYPYDKNRVILDTESGGTDYINASFINGYKQKKEFIATQGPKPESLIDFWRMIFQHNVYVIVMATQLKEGDIIKCHKYYPLYREEMQIGKYIKVRCNEEVSYDLYDKKTFRIEHSLEGIRRTIVHFHLKKWPDHGCPHEPSDLIEFVRLVKAERIPSSSPIVVHCSAGVGRTGTFIALDIIKQRLKTESKINIFETVKELRFQRMKMVQNIEQYEFLYACTFELVKQKRFSKTGKWKQRIAQQQQRSGKNDVEPSDRTVPRIGFEDLESVL